MDSGRDANYFMLLSKTLIMQSQLMLDATCEVLGAETEGLPPGGELPKVISLNLTLMLMQWSCS